MNILGELIGENHGEKEKKGLYFDSLLCPMQNMLEQGILNKLFKILHVRHGNEFEYNNFNEDHLRLNNMNVCFGE